MLERWRVLATRTPEFLYAKLSRALMPLFGNSSASVALRYRCLLLIVTIYLIYVNYEQQTRLGLIIAEKDQQLGDIERRETSLSQKMRIIWEHKRRIEKLMEEKNDEMGRIRKMMKLKDSEILTMSQRSEKCEIELDECKAKRIGQTTSTTPIVFQDVSALNYRIGSLEEVVKRSTSDLHNKTMELASCRETLKKYTGVNS
ncbi:unnamed protein product [Caenorhabditis bovis]|uniref:Uncharacterized protein n=1 Tax=Caenorhabditis bovis TaxID=2654633 RepID=A0A8S1EU09_9PELO|nr:unnamed protein product [Caenorhabditis bovis]